MTKSEPNARRAKTGLVFPSSRNLGHSVFPLPVITLLLVKGAVAVALIPGAAAWLVYDRSAILSGQIWRMFTGHWVHFSMSHLVYDLLALGVAGWLCEAQKLPRYGWLCLLAPWLISATLLMVEPHLVRYGGLSALATAVMVYLTLNGLRGPAPWRWLCLAVLLGMAGKTTFEWFSGRMLFATIGDTQVIVSVTSHLAGAGIALLFWVFPGLAGGGLLKH